MQLSGAELEIMELIWAAQGPVTCGQLRRQLAGTRGWKTTTILTFLSRLVEKGMLQVTRSGRVNQYRPTMTRGGYQSGESAAFLRRMYGGSLQRMVVSLCEGGQVSAQELAALRQWLSEEGGGAG